MVSLYSRTRDVPKMYNVVYYLNFTGQAVGNEAYRDALRRAATNTPATVTNSVYSPIYSLGPDWPPLRLNQCDDEDTLDNLERYLTKRVTTRNTLGTVLICGYQIIGRKVKFF